MKNAVLLNSNVKLEGTANSLTSNQSIQKRIARILYSVNCTACIFIGSLHTLVHFQELRSDLIASKLGFEAPVQGLMANVFNLWQGMSLLMGIFIILLGLSHFVILSISGKNSFPPISSSLIFVLMQGFVIYAGLNFFTTWQVYGGSIGMLLQFIVITLCLKGLNKA